MLSRLPQLHSEDNVMDRFQISDPANVDVYFFGASFVVPRYFGTRHESSLDGLSSGLSYHRASSLDGLPLRGYFHRGGQGGFGRTIDNFRGDGR